MIPMEIKNLFLYGDLAKENYMEQSIEYVAREEKRICKFKKTNCKFKQSLRKWFLEFFLNYKLYFLGIKIDFGIHLFLPPNQKMFYEYH